jgi:hypothetical protein
MAAEYITAQVLFGIEGYADERCIPNISCLGMNVDCVMGMIHLHPYCSPHPRFSGNWNSVFSSCLTALPAFAPT